MFELGLFKTSLKLEFELVSGQVEPSQANLLNEPFLTSRTYKTSRTSTYLAYEPTTRAEPQTAREQLDLLQSYRHVRISKTIVIVYRVEGEIEGHILVEFDR